MNKKVLVTGGCGYIGSHVVRQLTETGYKVTVLDNLSTGYSDALIYGEKLVKADLSDTKRLEDLLKEENFSAVLHFAASIVVPESVKNPIFYYKNNTANTINLLNLCVKYSVKKIIFSSTAAVYGTTDKPLVTENDPVYPQNPYARSKLMDEQVLQDIEQAHGVESVILRYFNVAGADPKLRMGQRYPGATHLIKVTCEAAVGKRSEVTVFGTDYDTPDGTGVRDYIHIEDLADAHLLALKYLEGGGKSDVFNCGYGKGYSVKQVIQEVQNIITTKLLIKNGPRREGDVAQLIADSSRFNTKLGWEPKHANLSEIVESALGWEKKMAKGE